jgi:hypothetical protein
MKYVQVAVILLAAVAFAAASDYPAAPYKADYKPDYKPEYKPAYKPAYPAYKEEYVSCLNLIKSRFILM